MRAKLAALSASPRRTLALDLDHERLQHRARRPRPRPRRRDRHDGRRALRPPRRAGRVAGAGARGARARPSARAGARGAAGRGDAEDAAPRALARLLDERQPLPGARAEGAKRACRCSWTARSPPARSRSTPASSTSTAFSCQKWLCGPDGTGALVRRATRRRSRRPRRATSRRSRYEPSGRVRSARGRRAFRLRLDRRRRRWPGCAALDVAPEWRFERAAEMAARCRERSPSASEVVTRAGPGTLVSFRAKASRRRSSSASTSGVVVRDMPRHGWLRVSCGWWTRRRGRLRGSPSAVASIESTGHLTNTSKAGPKPATSAWQPELARDRLQRLDRRCAMCSSSSTPSSSAPS